MISRSLATPGSTKTVSRVRSKDVQNTSPSSACWDGNFATHGPQPLSEKRVGIIFNHRAHQNALDVKRSTRVGTALNWASPRTLDELDIAIAGFAEQQVDALVIDGGDGTIRNVLTVAARYFGDNMPVVAIIPSGKTNALAIDLGVPSETMLSDVLEMFQTGRTRFRSPIEIDRVGDPHASLRGFLFGAGGFVKATRLAQTTHRMGAFRGLAVGLAIAAAVAQTVFAGRNNPWRRGDRMRLQLDNGQIVDQPLYLLLGSTLERLPLGLKPFGRVRPGLKLLRVDAPPKSMLTTTPVLLAGSEASWLDRRGYRRDDVQSLQITLETEFILDGERYPGGELVLRQGRPIQFVVP